jgi:XTP/dITP diphosphohydrolase
VTRLLVATTNPDKLREIRAILAHLPVEILTLKDLGPVPEPEETGTTFMENARIKARFYDRCLDRHEGERPCTVAEDSGLVIDALEGAPGVHSARFVRPDASYPERFAEIDRRLATASAAKRRARFICALTVVRNGQIVFETTGSVEGEVAESPKGTGGFGYDPIFYYPPYGRTLGEVTDDEKRRVAHRGEAFRRLAMWLERGTQNPELDSRGM